MGYDGEDIFNGGIPSGRGKVRPMRRTTLQPKTALGRNLQAALADRGLDMKQVSLDAGFGETYVRDIIAGRTRRPPEENLKKLCAVMGGIDVEQLLAETAISARQRPLPGGNAALVLRPVRQFAGEEDLMPIRSAARGGAEQEMFLEDGPIGYTRRPESLQGVREAYGIYMVGDSMSPRYEPGWLLHVNPFRPAAAGRDVVVYKTNNAVLIKQFVSFGAKELVLRQINPVEQLRIPAREVNEVHLIVGSDQEGG